MYAYMEHTYPLRPAPSRSKGEQYTCPHATGAALQHLDIHIVCVYIVYEIHRVYTHIIDASFEYKRLVRISSVSMHRYYKCILWYTLVYTGMYI